MGFSRQQYWSGVPFAFPEDLPNTGLPGPLHYRQVTYHLSQMIQGLAKAR